MRAERSLDVLNFVLAGAREGFGPFIAVYLQAQGYDPAATGVVMSLAGVGGLFCTAPIGAWVDHSVRKRQLLAAAVTLISMGAMLIIVYRSIFIVGLGQLAIGIGDTALAPLIAALTLGLVGQAGFALRMSRNEACNNAGNATRSALAGVLGYFLGLQYVAVTIVLSALASALVAFQIRPQAIDDVAARAGEKDDQPAWRALMRVPGLILLAATVLIYQVASSAMLPFLAEARTAAGSNASITTAVMCVIARAAMVPSALFVPLIARRFGYAAVMTLVLLLVAARACLAYFANDWTIVVLVELLEGLASGMALVAVPVLNVELMAGTGRASAALGAVLTAFGAGATLSPLLGGFVADHFGFGGSFIAYAITATAGVALWTGGTRFLQVRAREKAEFKPALDPHRVSSEGLGNAE